MTALSDDDLFAALTQVKVFTPMLAQALADHISTKAKERDALQARLAEAERLLRKWHGSGHYDCEDGWYSCPMHPDYAGHDDPNHCSCGHKEIAAFLGATDSASLAQE